MKRTSGVIFRTFAVIMLLTAYSCAHEPDYFNNADPILVDNCDPETVYFDNDVLPIFLTSCGMSGCHDPATATRNVILTDYVNIVTTGKVHAGDAGKSKIYKAITGAGFAEEMPPEGRDPLTSDQIDLIARWIDQGAWNLRCVNDNCDSTVTTFSGAVWPTIQKNCTGCHSGADAGAGIRMTNYQEVAAIAVQQRFIGAITHTGNFVPMPQNGTMLSDCHIYQIQQWIAAGTPDN